MYPGTRLSRNERPAEPAFRTTSAYWEKGGLDFTSSDRPPTQFFHLAVKRIKPRLPIMAPSTSASPISPSKIPPKSVDPAGESPPLSWLPESNQIEIRKKKKKV